MHVLRCSSPLRLREALARLGKEPVLLLDPAKVSSGEELLLADRLAKSSIRRGRAISKSHAVEFLLWLSGRTDIRSAFSSFGAKSAEDMLIISFGPGSKKLAALLELKEKKLNLPKSASPEMIERISLSRV